MNRTLVSISAIFLITLVVGSTFYFAPWVFTGQQNTVLSVSSVNINPQGYESADQVKGTYWSVLMTASYDDVVSFYQFDDNEAQKYNPSWQGKDVEVKNTIKIEVDPAQPYYERSITTKSNHVVVPRAYRNYLGPTILAYGRDQGAWKVNALLSNHFETSTSDWQLHTPFTIKVYKNGALVGTQTMDLFGNSAPAQNIALDGKDVTIGSGSQYVTVESLGALTGSASAPNWASVVGWSNQYMYLNSPGIQKALQNPYPSGGGPASTTWMNAEDYQGTYAWYWYGKEASGKHFNWYWQDDGTPCPVQWKFPGVSIEYESILLSGGSTPGWKSDPEQITGYTRVVPIQPVKFPSEEASDRRQYYSLTEYIEKVVAAQKIMSGLMPSWESNVNNVQINSQTGKMRINIPFNYFNPLLVIRISSELANTVVWEPPVANIKIVTPTSGTDFGEVADRKTVSMTLRQDSTVASAGTVNIEPITSGMSWAFEPQAWGTGTLSPGETKTFSFDIVDLTTTEEKTGQFKVTVTNSLGYVTDSATYKVTLLPVGGNNTMLFVRTINKATRVDVAGIHVVVSYNDQTMQKEGYTPITFDFGGTTPYVDVQSVATQDYKAAFDGRQLNFGLNTITLELEPIGYEEPWWIKYWWLIAAIVVVVCVLCVTLYYVRKKRKKRR